MPIQCPTLTDLPEATIGKTGWPWTEETPPPPATMGDGSPWPTVSIVTPSYNQGAFLEETIRSVLLQGYPSLEYFVVDGGSTDNSVEIIEKYRPWLTYAVSEPDAGQSNAINKGLQRATGTYHGWLNSDDFYYPGALQILVHTALRHSGHVIWGNSQVVDVSARPSRVMHKSFYSRETLRRGIGTLGQPATLWHSSVTRSFGGVSEHLHFAMDYDWWMRAASLPSCHFVGIPQVVAAERVHDGQKTNRKNRHSLISEMALVFRSHHPGAFRTLVVPDLAPHSFSKASPVTAPVPD